MYEKYYAHQLYKHGYLRINDKKNKDKITKIIKMANELRSKKGYPNDLMAVNVGLRPDHRMSIPELEQSFENCIKTQVVLDNCATDESIHPSDMKWVRNKASDKLQSKQNLMDVFLNLVKHQPRRRPKSVKISRRATPPNISKPIKTRSRKSDSQQS